MDGNIYQLNRYMDEYDYMLIKEQMIENEMDRRYSKAISKLEEYVNPALIEGFAKTLAEAYRETDCSSAEMIVEVCGLTEDDLKAIRGDDDGIFEYLCDQQKLFRYEYAQDEYEANYG